MNKYINNEIDKNKIINKILLDNNVDAIILYNPKNRLWYSEFKSTKGYILIAKNKSILYVDGRYITAAKETSKNINEIKQFSNIFELLNQDIKKLSIKSIAVEGDFVTYCEYQKFSKFINAKIKSIDTSEIRTIKNNKEISLIHKACNISIKTFDEVLKKIKLGMTELDIDSIIFSEFMKHGADEPSFPSIIASGKRGALPHGRASNKKLQNNDMITIDFGCYYKGYSSDVTRTISLGEPNNKLKEIYKIVQIAQSKGIELIKPGISTIEIDKACRDYIEKNGYGKYFSHATGHGLGADVHEFPRVSSWCDVKLKPGMIITVEPGIYIPDLGGVRIEDDILVTETGYKVLTKSKTDKLIKL